MYTKTKINNLTKNNKILYEKDNWKLTAIYDYEGLIGEAIFCNHFTRTCLRRKEDFFLKINSEKNKKILLPVYILKNEKLKYYRQIERQYPHGIKIYNQLNVPTWIRKKDIPNDITKIDLPGNYSNGLVVFNLYIKDITQIVKKLNYFKYNKSI